MTQTRPDPLRAPAFGWRVTKYDPRHRDADGRYTRDDWIGAAQIGKTFEDGLLTEQEYLRVEALYADAVLVLWRASGAPPVQIQAPARVARETP